MQEMNFYQAVYQIVGCIPRGQITTYGSIATWLGAPRAARAVGYALAADSCGDIPWHRVINQQGRVSEGGAPWRADEQRRRLAAEKTPFSRPEILDLVGSGFRPSDVQLKRWAALGQKVVQSRLER